MKEDSQSSDERLPDTVTATEIAAWVYCPEQWRLEHGLHLPSSSQPRRLAGTSHHIGLATVERRTRHASAPRRSGCAFALFQIVIVVGALAAFLCWAAS